MLVRVVLDTSIVVAGLRSRMGASYRVLQLVSEERIVALATPPLFLEYEDVIKRAEQRMAHGLSSEELDEFLMAFAALIEPVEVRFMWRPQLPDPKDEMVLEAAVNGHADAIVTHNVADFPPAQDRFGIPIVRPAELLKKVRS